MSIKRFGLVVMAVTLPLMMSSTGVAQERVPVLDFCALKATGSDAAYQKQRLVIFGLGGKELIGKGEEQLNDEGEVVRKLKIVKGVKGVRHVSDLFKSTFAMSRFWNLYAAPKAPNSWYEADLLSVKKVSAYLAKRSPRAKKFMSYSVHCADFIALPRMTEYKGTWRIQQSEKVVKGRKVKVEIPSLSIVSSLEMAVFKRTEEGFEKVATVAESGGGLFDSITDLGASTMEAAEQGNEMLAGKLQSGVDKMRDSVAAAEEKLKKLEAQKNAFESKVNNLVSDVGKIERKLKRTKNRKKRKTYQLKLDGLNGHLDEARAQIAELDAQMQAAVDFIKDPMSGADQMAREQNAGWADMATGIPGKECSVGKPVDGRPGLSGVCEEPKPSLPKRELGVAGMSERSGKYCRKIDKTNIRKVALCEVRVRAENLTLVVQKAAKQLEGWQLFAPLEETEEVGPVVSIGEEEGVRPGDIYVAKVQNEDGSWSSSGFARVVAAGPGGGKGAGSELTWRAGGADSGVRMEEHPQIGVALGILPAASGMLETSDSPLVLKMEGWIGSSIEVGYNLTPYMNFGWGEFWLRTHTDFYHTAGVFQPGVLGSEESRIDWGFINLYAGPELKIYLFRYVDLFASLAGGTTMVLGFSDAKLKGDGGKEIQDLAFGIGYGAIGDAGLDIVFHPDWSLRIGGQYRYNFGDIEVEGPKVEDIFEGVSAFEGDAEKRNLGTLSGVNAMMGLNYIF